MVFFPLKLCCNDEIDQPSLVASSKLNGNHNSCIDTSEKRENQNWCILVDVVSNTTTQYVSVEFFTKIL